MDGEGVGLPAGGHGAAGGGGGGGGGFAFLGAPGGSVHQLPQVVLGKHVHGEIDPHLWQDVRNARAYAEVIRDALCTADPDGAEIYDRNARTALLLLTRSRRRHG
ncbi:metal ABC transporter solute-binding protein, Zn/Mn family [Saccharothrix sp. ALI-22-I]|uniref:metal ABC transporter solute-binding protein, Zn/Mn family n=1 Tax=Saccharothrix sp. ALI-22-I TaxID=1933778 RepID=UPI0030827EF6